MLPRRFAVYTALAFALSTPLGCAATAAPARPRHGFGRARDLGGGPGVPQCAGRRAPRKPGTARATCSAARGASAGFVRRVLAARAAAAPGRPGRRQRRRGLLHAPRRHLRRRPAAPRLGPRARRARRLHRLRPRVSEARLEHRRRPVALLRGAVALPRRRGPAGGGRTRARRGNCSRTRATRPAKAALRSPRRCSPTDASPPGSGFGPWSSRTSSRRPSGSARARSTPTASPSTRRCSRRRSTARRSGSPRTSGG